MDIPTPTLGTRIILAGYFLALFGLFLWVPWRASRKIGESILRGPIVHGWIWSVPEPWQSQGPALAPLFQATWLPEFDELDAFVAHRVVAPAHWDFSFTKRWMEIDWPLAAAEKAALTSLLATILVWRGVWSHIIIWKKALKTERRLTQL